jgi:uncharacterized repeat protein (TIGR01451 family)
MNAFGSRQVRALLAVGLVASSLPVPARAVDRRPGPASAVETDVLSGQADVAVTDTVSVATPTVGSNVTYTVTARNNGSSDAHSVTVTDKLPNGLTFVSSTASAGSYAPATGAWTVGTIATGASETLSIVATVTSGQAIVNLASVTAQAESDPNSSNNTSLVSINKPGPMADLQLWETVDDDTPAPGQDVTFTVTLFNAGPSRVGSGVFNPLLVLDNIPSGLTFVSATASQGNYNPSTGVWLMGGIGSHESLTLQVVATVASSAPLTRVVTKTQPQTVPDPVSDNDTDSVTLNDNTLADLAMSMVASQEPVPPETTFTYGIVVSNHGPAAATNVVATDSLPAGVTFVSATPTQGSCTGTTNVSCNLGTLPDGLSAYIDLVVTKTVGGNVSNSAAVAATEADPFMPNNSNSETSTPAELTNFRVE